MVLMNMKSIINNLKIIDVGKEDITAVNGYNIFKYDFNKKVFKRQTKIIDGINTLFSELPLIRRLLRAEITKYYHLLDDSELCIARKGIFCKELNKKSFVKTFNIKRGSRPMNICEDVDGSLYFGEYFQNMEKKAVHIYGSHDHGKTWEIVHTFPEGNINHVHGIYMDPYTKKMWFATGDRENECIIGYTEDGFKTIKEVFRGGQEYRTCVMFFYKDYIVFATDSQYQQNELKKFDRKTLEITHLQDVQGPVIRGAQIGDVSMISTDVEPSEVNKDTKAYVWISKDGLKWEVLCSAEKDWLPSMLFQFGVFDLPSYDKSLKVQDGQGFKVYVTGKAVKKYGGHTLVFDYK